MTNEQLVADYAATHSAATLDQIVRRNQRLIHHVLKRFATAAEPYEDLVQVGNLGLIKAVQRFDPSRKVKFSTYAVAFIEGEIRHHLRDSLLMRQPRWVKRVYRQIEETVSELTRALGRQPSLREISEAMNVGEGGILEVLNLYSHIDLHAFDEPVSEADLRAQADRSELHALRTESFALPIEDRIALYDALDKLSAFERRIIYLLFFREFTQVEVAAALGLTQKKVSRESIRALSRLKEVLSRRII